MAQLERAAPARALQSVAMVAAGGWTSAWRSPAAGARTAGVILGVEHSGFASVTTMLVGARFQLGTLWQVSAGQTQVRDLFDPVLLEQYPELATLTAGATLLRVDAVTTPRNGIGFSLGVGAERDEWLGDANTAWTFRTSIAATLPLDVTATAVAERVIGGGTLDAGPGQVTLGIGRRFAAGRLALELGAGLQIGRLWHDGSSSMAAGAARAELGGALSLAVAVGAQRDAYVTDGWLGFGVVGLGVRVGSVGADLLRGGPGDAQATPTAVSVLYDRR